MKIVFDTTKIYKRDASLQTFLALVRQDILYEYKYFSHVNNAKIDITEINHRYFNFNEISKTDVWIILTCKVVIETLPNAELVVDLTNEN